MTVRTWALRRGASSREGGPWDKRVVRARGGGWVPASARTTGGGMGPRIREDNGRWDGSPHPREQQGVGWVPASAGTTGGGMGPRIREDNGGWDGSPHPRGQQGVGWVPAFARTRRGGGEVCTPILTFPPEGGRERKGEGSCIREDNGGVGASLAYGFLL